MAMMNAPFSSRDEWLLWCDAMLEAHNWCRRQPEEVVDELRAMRERFDGKMLSVVAAPYAGDGGGVHDSARVIATKEGVAAVDEAIAYIEREVIAPRAAGSKPVPRELQLVEALCYAAQDHANDLGVGNFLGHASSDAGMPIDRMQRYTQVIGAAGENIHFGGGDARHVLLGLIVDDGVPDRGHRTTLYDPQWRYVGFGVAVHKNYPRVTVIDYAFNCYTPSSSSELRSEHSTRTSELMRIHSNPEHVERIQSNLETPEVLAVCHACGKPITQHILRIGDDAYHAACFCCARCGQSMAGERYIDMGELGYLHVHCFTCVHCGQRIEGKYRTSKDVPEEKRAAPRAPASASASASASTLPDLYHDECFDDLYGIKCVVCRRTIVGQYLQVGERLMHVACVRCKRCAKPIDGKRMVHEGELYDEACFDELFTPKCARCREFVRGRYFESKGRVYHESCFTCVQCNATLERFMETPEGEMLCEECHAERFAKRCVMCNKPIRGKYKTFGDDKPVHVECFNCAHCGRAIEGRYVPHEDGVRVYHSECFAIMNAAPCAVCAQPAVSQALRLADGRTIHRDCFVCVRCKRAIDGAYVEARGGAGFLHYECPE